MSQPRRKRHVGLVPTIVSMFVALLAVFTLATARGRVLPRVNTVDAVLPSVGEDRVRLELLTYNVFVRPQPISYGDETECRSNRIGEWLAEDSGSDIVVLTETFRSDDVEKLSEKALVRFPHQALSLPDSDSVTGVSGGLSLLSRWPIESVQTEAFEACSGRFSDCLSTKGILHAVVKITDDLRVNVLATHLDAGSDESDAMARSAQLEQIQRFVNRNVDTSQPTLLMGDFNIDGFPGARSQYPELISTLTRLNDREPIDAVRSVAPIWSAEAMFGQLFNTMNCNTTIWCDDNSPNFAAKSARRRRLDYVFALDDHLDRVRFLDAEHLPMEDGTCGSRWLSDHKAVRASVEIDR